jgi:hypothetical protein
MRGRIPAKCTVAQIAGAQTDFNRFATEHPAQPAAPKPRLRGGVPAAMPRAHRQGAALYFLTGGSTGGGASPSQSSPTCVQSSPHSSIGCCPLSVPLPQRMSSAGQKCSHPQQMRSGCPGRIGNLRFILYGIRLALGRQARAVLVYAFANADAVFAHSECWNGSRVGGPQAARKPSVVGDGALLEGGRDAAGFQRRSRRQSCRGQNLLFVESFVRQ